MLASGILDRTVRLWDVATGEVQQTFTGHTRGVFSVSFSSEGQVLASGSQDGTILLWDVAPTVPDPEKPAEDLNGDGVVNIQDLVRGAAALTAAVGKWKGKVVPTKIVVSSGGVREDIHRDGIKKELASTGEEAC